MNDNHNGAAIVPVAIADEQSLREKIYNIRGQQVMLSFDLADIYGYEHKRFMEQVRNNKEKLQCSSQFFFFFFALPHKYLCAPADCLSVHHNSS